MTNALLTRLGMNVPIIQAPMAGVATPALAAAVSNAGGLGSLGLADLPPEKARAAIDDLRDRTNRSFNLNFFVNEPAALDRYDAGPMAARLAPYYAEYGLGAVPAPKAPYPPFGAAGVELLLATRPAVASFHFGLPEASAVTALRDAGILIMGSATTIAEAKALEAGGADAIVAQGWEAGGHRGVFLGNADAPSAGTLALTRQIVMAVKLPVIAAGGIADGAGIAAVLALGAAAAQIGTAFLLCPEAATKPVHRAAIVNAKDNDTTVTRVFSGRPARVIANRFVHEMSDAAVLAAPFPAQHSLTSPLRQPSQDRGSTDFLPLYAGQAAGMARAVPAAELMNALALEWRAATKR
ncbi:MAG: nitronate monooxygenase [Rhodospirillaceae bacterium]|nr:nitronate monooxygenase [Rhodospirillaceae bacterium]